jgi:hypothetical protein
LIGNVAPIVQQLSWLPHEDYPSMPFWKQLNTKGLVAPENIIAYRNGLLDITRYLSGEIGLGKHTPSWCSTIAMPYDLKWTPKTGPANKV